MDEQKKGKEATGQGSYCVEDLKGKLQAEFNGEILVFEEHKAIGNGSCGFISLGVSREEIATLLLKYTDDEDVRRELAPEIEGLLRTSPSHPLCTSNIRSFFTELSGAEEAADKKLREFNDQLEKIYSNPPFKRLKNLTELITFLKNLSQYATELPSLYKAQERLSKIETQVAQLCQSKQLFERYLQSLAKNEWLGHISAKLFARFKNYNLYIFSSSGMPPGWLQFVMEQTCENPKNTFYLVHTNNSTHYNLLSKVGSFPLCLAPFVPSKTKIDELPTHPNKTVFSNPSTETTRMTEEHTTSPSAYSSNSCPGPATGVNNLFGEEKKGKGEKTENQQSDPHKKQLKRHAFKLGAIKKNEYKKYGDLKTAFKGYELESGTTHLREKSDAISIHVIRKAGNSLLDSADPWLTIVRGPWNSIPAFLGFKQTAFNFPYISKTHFPVTAHSVMIAIIYPLLQLQLTVEDLRSDRFNKSPEELFKEFFLNDPQNSLKIINKYLKDIYNRNPALQKKYDSLELRYEITNEEGAEEELEFYLCLTKKAERIKPAKETKWGKVRKFFKHQVDNFLSAANEAFYIPSIFYWIAWALFAIIVANHYLYIIPGNLLFSTIVGVVIPLGFVGLLFGKRLFIWIDNHFDFPKSGFWNKSIKPCFDHPRDPENGFWPTWPALPKAPNEPTWRQKSFRGVLHLTRILALGLALIPIALIVPYCLDIIPGTTFYLSSLPAIFLVINFLGVFFSSPFRTQNLITPPLLAETYPAFFIFKIKFKLALESTFKRSRWLAFLIVSPLLAIAMPFIAIGALYGSHDRQKTGKPFARSLALLGLIPTILFLTDLLPINFLAAYEWVSIFLPLTAVFLFLPSLCWFIASRGKNAKFLLTALMTLGGLTLITLFTLCALGTLTTFAAYEWTHVFFPVTGVLLILPGLCWLIANSCGVSGKSDKNVYYLKELPGKNDLKDAYKNSCIIISSDDPSIKDKFYYIDQDGSQSEELNMAAIPDSIRQEMVSSRKKNEVLSGEARKWANKQIATNKENYYAKKATSEKTERFSAPMRELSILSQYEHAERIQKEREAKEKLKHQFNSYPFNDKHTETPEDSKAENKTNSPLSENDELTSWFTPPKKVGNIELFCHFWMTFINRTLGFEYIIWFILVVLAYMLIIPDTFDASTALSAVGSTKIVLYTIASLIIGLSLLITIWKTFGRYKTEKNAFAKRESGPDIYVVDDLKKISDEHLAKKHAGGYVFDIATKSVFYISPKECDFVLMRKKGAPDPELFSRNAYVYNQTDNNFYYIDKSKKSPIDCHKDGQPVINVMKLYLKLGVNRKNFSSDKEEKYEILIEDLSAKQLETLDGIIDYTRGIKEKIVFDQDTERAAESTIWDTIGNMDFHPNVALKDWVNWATPNNQQKLLPLLWNHIAKAENGSLKNIPILQTQRYLQKIASLKDAVKKENTDLAYLKLRLKAANIPHDPDPNIPDATALENLGSLKKKEKTSSALLKFLRNPYWVSMAFIAIFWVNSFYPARIFFLAGTGITTFILQMPVVEIFNALHEEFTPLISVGFLSAYFVAHALMGIYKKRQEERHESEEKQLKLASLQEECLTKQVKILQEYKKYLKNQLPKDASEEELPYHDLYPEPALYDSAKKKIGYQKFTYFFAWLSLALIFAMLSALTLPKFAHLLPIGVAIIICTCFALVAVTALFLQHWLMGHLFVKREHKIRIGLGISLVTSLIPFLFSDTYFFTTHPFLCAIPALFTAGFFVISFNYPISDLLREKKAEINSILLPKDRLSVLFRNKDKQLMLHIVTLLLSAMNPNGSDKKIDAAQWGGEKKMFYDFSQLERFKEKLKANEPINLEVRESIQKIINHYSNSPEQKNIKQNTSSEKTTKRTQFIETYSFIFLFIVACAIVYLPAALLDPDTTLQWCLAAIPFLLYFPRVLIEWFVPQKKYDLVIAPEFPTSESISKYVRNTFVLVPDVGGNMPQLLYYSHEATRLSDVIPFEDVSGESARHLEEISQALGTTTGKMRITKNISREDLSKAPSISNIIPLGITFSNLAVLSEKLTSANIYKISPNTLVLEYDEKDPSVKRLYYVKPMNPENLKPFQTLNQETFESKLKKLKCSFNFTQKTGTIEDISREELLSIFSDGEEKTLIENCLEEIKKFSRYTPVKFIRYFSIIRLTKIVLNLIINILVWGSLIFSGDVLFSPDSHMEMLGFLGLSNFSFVICFIAVSLFLVQIPLKYLALFPVSTSKNAEASTLQSSLLKRMFLFCFIYSAERAPGLLKFYVKINVIPLAIAAFALPLFSFLSLAGVLDSLIVIPSIVGLIGVISSVPTSLLIFKFLLPRALFAIKSDKNDTFEKMEEKRKIAENTGKWVVCGFSFIMIVPLVILFAVDHNISSSFGVVLGSWGLGLSIGLCIKYWSNVKCWLHESKEICWKESQEGSKKFSGFAQELTPTTTAAIPESVRFSPRTISMENFSHHAGSSKQQSLPYGHLYRYVPPRDEDEVAIFQDNSNATYAQLN